MRALVLRSLLQPLLSDAGAVKTLLPSAARRAMSSEPTGSLQDVCVVGAARTPFGSFLGSLAPLSATQLGSTAIKGALQKAGLDPTEVQEVFMGNVLSANLGQAPARQAALGAGLPESVVCTTVNKVCASGLKAVMLAALSIHTGMSDIVVAGGMESMSNCPHYLPAAARSPGLRMGHAQIIDGMLHDGLWDPYNGVHMGLCADTFANEHGISREQQDRHAEESVRRAKEALAAGLTAREIVPCEVPGKRNSPPQTITDDDALSKARPERLPTLRPAFSKLETATVTAGNSSPITDGAAALVLASRAAAERLKLPVLAKVVGMGDAAQHPTQFITSPALAVPKCLAHANLSDAVVEYYEINEAFSAVDIANRRLLQLDDSRVNVHGGAVALGHPIGASGAAILVRLVNVLIAKDAKIGVAAICNGGGGASAVAIQCL